jgi:hypothetical protein
LARNPPFVSHCARFELINRAIKSFSPENPQLAPVLIGFRMDLVYFVESDIENAGDIATAVEGKLLVDRIDFLNSIAKSLGLPALDSFYSCADSFLEDIGVDPSGVADGEQWYATESGIRWFTVVGNYIKANRSTIDDADELARELSGFRETVSEVASCGGRWRLALDF